jgi:hypothetical protein
MKCALVHNLLSYSSSAAAPTVPNPAEQFPTAEASVNSLGTVGAAAVSSSAAIVSSSSHNALVFNA